MGKRKIDSEKHLRFIKAGYWLMIICILLLGSLLTIGAPDEVGTNLSIIVMILIVFYLWGYLGLGRMHKDERLAKIASRAMTISWGFTILTVSVLATLRGTYFPNIGGGQILGIIIVVMVLSMAVSNEIYKRKGDIDW